MTAYIVFGSAYGNTKKIAETLSSVSHPVVHTIVKSVNDAPDISPQAGDIVVVGSPTQGGRPMAEVQAFIKNLPSLSGVYVAAFDTRFGINDHGLGLKIVMKMTGFAAPRILASLTSKGGVPAAQPLGCIVSDTKGPLADNELERARQWMQHIIKKPHVSEREYS